MTLQQSNLPEYKFLTTIFSVSTILLILIFCGCTKSFRPKPGEDKPTEWSAFLKQYGQKANVEWNNKTRLPRRITGIRYSVDMPQDSIEAERIIRNFIKKQMKLPGIANIKNLKVQKIHRRFGNWMIQYDQVYQNIPVEFGGLSFSLQPPGFITMMGLDYYSGINITTIPKIDENSAWESVEKDLQQKEGMLKDKFNDGLIIYPSVRNKNYQYVLCWKFKVLTENPPQLWVYYIDAKTGEVIQSQNIMRFDVCSGYVSGQIYPLDETETPISVSFAHENVDILDTAGSVIASAETDLDGQYSIEYSAEEAEQIQSFLRGPFVYVRPDDSVQPHLANIASSHDWDWGCGPEQNVFYHINYIHDYIASPPFDFHEIDRRVTCWVGVDELGCSAAYASWPWLLIQFGTGCGDLALKSDVIYHEYGHFIDDMIAYYPYEGEKAAIAEGKAHYFAAMLNNDPLITDWNLDNDLRTGADYLEGESYFKYHHNGTIIGGALWDLRERIGSEIADLLFFEAIQLVPIPLRFGELLENMLLADDDDSDLANGTPYDREIKQAFRNHQIGIDVFIPTSAEDDGNVPAPGESVWDSPNISNDAQPLSNADSSSDFENPVPGETNRLTFTIENLAAAYADNIPTANTVEITLYYADLNTYPVYPEDWTELPGSPIVISELEPGSTQSASLDWVPPFTNADSPDLKSFLVRCNSPQDFISEDGDHRLDNNIALKSLCVEQFSNRFEFRKHRFWVSNPQAFIMMTSLDLKVNGIASNILEFPLAPSEKRLFDLYLANYKFPFGGGYLWSTSLLIREANGGDSGFIYKILPLSGSNISVDIIQHLAGMPDGGISLRIERY